MCFGQNPVAGDQWQSLKTAAQLQVLSRDGKAFPRTLTGEFQPSDVMLEDKFQST
jgi:hypothetical protein